jgi:hypothetical protein
MAKNTGQQRKQDSKGKGPSKYRDADKRQGRRFVFFWVPIIIVVLVFFYALVLDPPQPLGQPIPGTSSVTEKTQTGEAIGKAYMVNLDDGRIVKLDGFQMESIKAGRRVLVQENNSLIFKRKSFSFVRYLEEKQ